MLGKPQQPVSGDQGDAVRDPIDQLKLRMRRPLLEPEERDNAVDVDRQSAAQVAVYQR